MQGFLIIFYEKKPQQLHFLPQFASQKPWILPADPSIDLNLAGAIRKEQFQTSISFFWDIC